MMIAFILGTVITMLGIEVLDMQSKALNTANNINNIMQEINNIQ